MPRFSLPPERGPELRELFADPARWLGSPPSRLREQIFDLARWTSSSSVALFTSKGSWGETELCAGLTVEGEARETLEDRTALRLGVPLLPSGVGAQRVFAVLVVANPSPESDLERLAAHTTHLLLSEGLERVGEADLLTGLPARPSFERALLRAGAKLGAGESLCVLRLDVDRFGDLNARSGRGTGDELLRTLAVLLTSLAGKEGVVARTGPDEFSLLVEADEAASQALLARLEESLGALVGFGEAPPTLSLGFALGPSQGEEPTLLALRADQALRRARLEGLGQRVQWSEDLAGEARADTAAGVLTGQPARDQLHVRALLESTRALSRLGPLRETQDELLDRCLSVAGAERALLLLRSEGGEWRVEAARVPGKRNLGEDEPAFAASVASEALALGRSISRLAEEGPLSPSADQLGLTALLCAPLSGPDAPTGVVYVDSRARQAPYERATLAFFDALTGHLSLALTNASLYERLLSASQRDRARVAGREEELIRLRERFASLSGGAPSPVGGLIGSAPAMLEVFKLLETLKKTTVPVVVSGESGTGKELVARAIHGDSGREGPLVTVNCAAIAPNLFESELFGHKAGAFTGAHADRVGLLEAAEGGTLFLDEVGDLPLGLQAKLLRALQESEIRRLGESTPHPIDVRIVAATNRDLASMVSDGDFREDLYYRLAVFQVALPPLRDRAADIPALVEHLLEEAEGPQIAPAALQALVRYRWPGNVRQLGNVITRSAVIAGAGPILLEHVELPSATPTTTSSLDPSLLELPLKDAKAAFTQIYAREMLHRAGGSMPGAAELAGVTRQTLYRILGSS
jgi:diguanylate cyclase (GGDEF)-like protein